MIRWGQPNAGWGLLALALLGLGLFLWMRRRRRRLLLLADTELWPLLSRGWLPKSAGRRLVVWIAAMAMVVVALARPQWGFRWEEVRRRGADWMVVLDVSNSMMAPDFKPSRMQQAKWALRDLTRVLKGDRIGLTAFAGEAFLQCPMTADYGAFLLMLEEMRPGVIPRGGTAISRGLTHALERMETSKSEAERVMILITDGEELEGDARAAAEKCREAQVKLYVVGVGSTEGELVPAVEGAGYLKDREGNVVKSRLNESLLNDLARTTGGRYIRAAPGDFGLERLYEMVRPQMKQAENETSMRKVFTERAHLFLFAAIALLIVESVLPRQARPRRVKTSASVQEAP